MCFDLNVFAFGICKNQFIFMSIYEAEIYK